MLRQFVFVLEQSLIEARWRHRVRRYLELRFSLQQLRHSCLPLLATVILSLAKSFLCFDHAFVSSIQELHCEFGIPVTPNLTPLKKTCDLFHFFIIWLHWFRILSNSLSLRRSGNRNDFRHPRLFGDGQQPAQRQLTRATSFLCCQFFQFFYKLQVYLEILWLESWKHSTEVAFGNVISRFNLPCQEAAA